MRSLLLLFLLAISLPSRADDWSFVVSSGYRIASTCSAALSAERSSIYQEALRTTKGNLPLRIESDPNYTWCEKKTGDDGISKVYRTRPSAYAVFKYLGSPADIPASDLAADTIYNMAYTDEQCQAAYGGEMRSVTVPSGSLNTANAYVNTGACKLYQTPGVTFCTNNPDGTQECSTVWRAESTGEPNDPDAEGATVEESPFQLTDNPSSCANGSYSSGGKSYCYTGQSSDINTIHIGDDGNPVTDDGGTDTGGNTGGGDTGSGSDGGSTGGGSTGGGGSSGGGGGSSGGGGGASGGGGSNGGGSSGGGGGSSGGGSTGGDTSTDDNSTPPDDTDTPTQGDTGSGDSQESEEQGDGLDAVLDAIGGVRKAINDGFSNLVDKIAGVGNAIDKGNQAAEDRFSAMAESAPTQSDFQNKYGSDDDNNALVSEAIEGLGSQITPHITGSDSQLSGVVDDMSSWGQSVMPSVPAASCKPLVFAPGAVYSFTIDCDIFEMIRSALAWILYALTAYVVITTMFNSRPF